jgi:cytochrome P450
MTYSSDNENDTLASERGDDEAGYRSYEVFQRERVGAPPPVKPGQMRTQDYLDDPYSLLAKLRAYGPAWRDWPGNCFWVTHYNDVTSILADTANFAIRSKRWHYHLNDFGRDLRNQVPVLTAQAKGIDTNAETAAEELIGAMTKNGSADLVADFAAPYPLMLVARTIGIPDTDLPHFADRYLRMHRGWRWHPTNQDAGKRAMHELVDYFAPLLDARRSEPQDDWLSAIATLEIDGPPTDAHETLHGALANMWMLLLIHPDQLESVRGERRLVKYAYLETVRHSTPVISADRFARREVERFGLLIPEGALVICSAGAANRDERIFNDPDRFIVGRKDLVQREPRGQYRADGLPSGITPALGMPSKFPALPVGRPRSLYAITRDTATTASQVVLEMLPDIRLAAGANPVMKCKAWGEMHACWHLPVDF